MNTSVIKLYRPSNGTEGISFIAGWCGTCARRAVSVDDRNPLVGSWAECTIVARTFAFRVDEPEYPREWIHGEGGPECTAYVLDEGQGPPPPSAAELEAAGQGRLIP